MPDLAHRIFSKKCRPEREIPEAARGDFTRTGNRFPYKGFVRKGGGPIRDSADGMFCKIRVQRSAFAIASDTVI